MLKMLIEGYRTITDIDTFTFVVTAGLVLSAYMLIKVSTGSLLLASIFTPFMIVGGLAARYYFEVNFINLLGDKDSNTVLSVACGVLGSMLVMTLVSKCVGSYIDWRWRHTHPGNRMAAAE